MRSLLIILVGLTFFTINGCGGGAAVERNDISGSATFDGQPIVYGSLQFIPKHGDGTVAPTGTATIENGKYNTASAGQGIIRGPHEIRVTAYPSKPVANEDETVEVEAVEPLFVGYTFEKMLEPPTTNIEIPAEAKGFNNMKAAARKKSNDP